MRKNYSCPEIKFISVESVDILNASNDEVFVDGENLFD